MRLFKTLWIFFVLLLSPAAYAVTGDDVTPGTNCTVNKAMMMAANPTGICGYILTCEAGKWRATISAENPTQNQQVATKKYVDDALTDSIATIDTQTYTNIQRRVNTTGEFLPLLLTGITNARWPMIAAHLCSDLSGGNYVQGKILASQRRHIGTGIWYDPPTGTAYKCEDDCLLGPSGNRYAWAYAADFQALSFYTNVAPGHHSLPSNMGEVTTSLCGSWNHPGGPSTINGECMAGATSSRSSLSDIHSPTYTTAHVVNAITCWAN